MNFSKNQIWKCGDEYVRIVHLERLEVGYQIVQEPEEQHGQASAHQQKGPSVVMLKGAILSHRQPE